MRGAHRNVEFHGSQLVEKASAIYQKLEGTNQLLADLADINESLADFNRARIPLPVIQRDLEEAVKRLRTVDPRQFTALASTLGA